MTKSAGSAQAWVQKQRRGFYRHLGVYAIVNVGLLILGLVLLSFTPWWVWFIPGLAWGVGVAIHGLMALTAHEEDWREEQEQMKWWRQQRQHRHEERMAALTAFRSPNGRERRDARRVGAAEPAVPEPQRRVAVPPERLRVDPAGPDADDARAAHEAEAEVEALVGAAEPQRRRR